MRTMSWDEIDKDWTGLQKRQRLEIAQAVQRYCVGHKMEEVAKRLGQSRQWVASKLDVAGVASSLGEAGRTASLVGNSRGMQEDCERLVREFEPKITAKYTGATKDAVSIDGEDAEQFAGYLEHYLSEGHEATTALRLAKAEWAGEAAIEAGVIKEDVNKKNERVNRILFPQKQKDDFELDLASHMNKVRQAAKFLDGAKVNLLRRKSTCEKVAQAHAEWIDQVDRIRNFHSTFDKVV